MNYHQDKNIVRAISRSCEKYGVSNLLVAMFNDYYQNKRGGKNEDTAQEY